VDEVRSQLAAMEGITLFDLDDPGKIGLIVESANLDEAHYTIMHQIRKTEGVLGIWPIYANFEPENSH
jgi:nitrate reductase NapAB chaperone NapD